MAIINDHFLKLQAGYLFPEINRRVNAFIQAHPEAARRLIRCGIGDVTEPLPQAAIEAMHQAVDDLATHERFHGYGPGAGLFLAEGGDCEESLPGPRNSCGGGRDFRVRRREVRHGEHSGYFRQRKQDCRAGPGLSVYVDTKRDGRQYRGRPARTDPTRGWCICPARRRTILCPICHRNM